MKKKRALPWRKYKQTAGIPFRWKVRKHIKCLAPRLLRKTEGVVKEKKIREQVVGKNMLTAYGESTNRQQRPSKQTELLVVK